MSRQPAKSDATRPMSGPLDGYEPGHFWCELVDSVGKPHRYAQKVYERLNGFSAAELARRANAAERELFNLGITFTVYSQRDQIDRILPFDVLPRVISAKDWKTIETGVIQRVSAMNLFIADIYDRQKILKDGIVPSDLVLGNANYRPQMQGIKVPHGTYVHICGTDVVRGADGQFLVLEDNGRTPSGVSYVVENRLLTRRAFADLIRDIPVRDVEDYGERLHEQLATLAPPAVLDPQIVLLSPGTYNSAYFEHIFLAREMGVPLVEGRDLVVENDRVYMKTIDGLQQVDVIYRRLNDDFLDPEVFEPDSMLGVPGVMHAYRAGTVALANAVGTGIADDKAVYAYMPRIIKYYLGQDPVINNVPTHICREKEGFKYALNHLDELVVKPVGESGGYGITIGPRAAKRELAECRRKLVADPDNYVAQPMVELSVCPTLINRRVEPRHVDLRPFCITGQKSWVLPGGLTRVALRKGSIIVNSSQGGGSKDTWVLA
jgi:uncharacterized circularly permuted ATP-grasp superfamily protein